MFPHAALYQQSRPAVSVSHMPAESVGHYLQQPQPQRALPPLVISTSKPRGGGGVLSSHPYAGYARSSSSDTTAHMSASPRSPATCYSPGALMPSDATVVDYTGAPHASPQLSYASSKTASPVPLAALALAAEQQMQATKETSAGPMRVQKRRRGARSAYTAEEKEMRRKISHSAIEKRRRERTNNVLRDLQDMVPWLSKSNKVQKLEILEAAAQYIKELRGSGGPRPVPEEDLDDCASMSDDECCSPAQAAMKVNFLLS
ncbi:hypothetical protein GGI07_001577 [Coemansia sp. Benny D115]|nr:hypothetical protein GGI07_001577 [Coemansia sp. Benny D115]